MSVDELVEDIVKEFRADPRNKVFAQESLLIASTEEETGEHLSAEQLRSLIKDHQSGSLDDDDLEKFDGAVYVCSVLARLCFGENPDDEDEDVDYDISWIDNDDGSFSAEIRPS